MPKVNAAAGAGTAAMRPVRMPAFRVRPAHPRATSALSGSRVMKRRALSGKPRPVLKGATEVMAQLSHPLPPAEAAPARRHGPAPCRIAAPSPPTGRRPEIPDIPLHARDGAIRRDMAVKILQRVEARLAEQLRDANAAPPRIQGAMQRHHRMLQRLREDMASRLASSPHRVPDDELADGPNAVPDRGLEWTEHAQLAQALRQTRKSLRAKPSLLARLWRALYPPARKRPGYRPDALLEMLLRHFEVQVLGGWAALARVQIERAKDSGFAPYSHAGESRSEFLGGQTTVSASSVAGVPVGVVVGLTVRGRDLAACDDGSIEQARWTSGTAGAALSANFGAVKGNVSFTGSYKRRHGMFFNDVAHLVRSSKGVAHGEALSGPGMGELKKAWGKRRLVGSTGLSLRQLDAIQENAYAERDIFAKAVGPLDLNPGTRSDGLHMVAVDARAPDEVLPSAFTSSTWTAAAEAGFQAGLLQVLGASATLNAAISATDLAIRPRVGFWDAVRGVDTGASTVDAEARAERVSALQDAGRRIEGALAHLPSLRNTAEGRLVTEPFRIGVATAAQLRGLLDDMEQEFERYCYARRQIAAGTPRYKAMARHIEQSWGVQGAAGEKAMYAYVQRLGIVHALAGLRMQALGETDDLAQAHGRLARKLDAPGIPSYDRAKAQRYTTFGNELKVTLRNIPVSIKGQAGLLRNAERAGMGAFAQVEAKAEICVRRDWNMLRDGDYLYLSVDLGGQVAADVHLPAVGQFLSDRLPGLGPELLTQALEPAAEALKDSLMLGQQVSGSRRWTWTFFQPRDGGNASAMRLQHFRVTAGHGGPVHDKRHLLSEKMGTHTLSYLFMRHHAYFSAGSGDRAGHWERFCSGHRGEIDRIMAGLGEEETTVRGEAARYWDQVIAADRHRRSEDRRAVATLAPQETSDLSAPLIRQREAFFRAMSSYANALKAGKDAETAGARQAAWEALEELLEAHTQPWRDARGRHIRRSASIPLLH